MKLLNVTIGGLLISGLLSACGLTEAKPEEEEKEAEVAEVVEHEAYDPEEAYAAGMEFEPLPEYEIPEHLRRGVKLWIADMLEEFNRPPEERFDEAANDVGYVYYLRAKEVSEALYSGLGEDFDNLNALAGSIVHSQFVRTAHIDDRGGAMESLEHANEWRPLRKSTKMYYDYMKQLLNDLDVAINKNGEGETFGVTHILDGDKVEEMESFLRFNDVDEI